MLRSVASAGIGIAARTPGAPWLVRKSALVPIALKTQTFQRALAALARRAPQSNGMIETNGGIADDLRLLLPSSKTDLLFGRPCHSLAERATLELAQILARRSDAFLDVGANEGLFTFSIAARRNRRASLHCFEPDAAVFARLQENLRRNGIDAQAVNAAVGSDNGIATFYRNLSDDSSGSLTTHFASKHDVAATDVPVIRLSDYMVQNNCGRACVKVDVEGAGVAVWEGLVAKIDRVDALIMEIIGPEAEANLPGRIISEAGFNAFYIRDYELIPSQAGEFTYVAPFYNWLFTRHSRADIGGMIAGTRLVIV